MSSKKSLADYVKDAQLIHGNKYSYLRLYLKGKKPFLVIRCQAHGEFEKYTCNHIGNKQGCPKCSKPQSLTQADFELKANEKHENKYDYSSSKYEGTKTKVDIICSQHGEFSMLAGNHLAGQACPKCAHNAPVTTQSFVTRASALYDGLFNYSKVEYKSMDQPVIIICKEHGQFEQTPHNHLDSRNQSPCQRCSIRSVRCTATFIEKATSLHHNKYDCSKVDYNLSLEKVIIVCADHESFLQRPNDHLTGYGCPKCASSGSKTSVVQETYTFNMQ